MSWVDEEMKNSNLGDKRLDKRAVKMITSMSQSSEGTLTQCFKSRSELVGAYRLFDNPRSTPNKILFSHIESTKERIKGQSVVLLPNDTSSIDFTSKSSVQGLGILESAHNYGILLHPTIATTPERVCLGCVDAYMWSRDPDAKRKSVPRNIRSNQPIEEKESFRWIRSYRVGAELAKEFPETQFISMGDRESDIYELIYEAVETKKKYNNIDIILRINHNRTVITDESFFEETGIDKKDGDKLKELTLKAPIVGEITFEKPAGRGIPKRLVKQKLRSMKIKLNGKVVGDKVYDPVEINVVCAVEENPPKGKKPICWMFFTTIPIDNKDNVFKVIEFYLCRWDIEVFFNVIKNGCKVEESELKAAHRIQNMISLFLIVAWRVMYIMNLSRNQPNISCSEIFEESEWKSVYKVINKNKKPNKPPPGIGINSVSTLDQTSTTSDNSGVSTSVVDEIKPLAPPPLGEFVLMLASLGGYLHRKNSPPGPKVIWRGLKCLHYLSLAWDCFGNTHDKKT